MNRFKSSLIILSVLALHLFWGCSSDNNNNGGSSQIPDHYENELVIYEAYPGLFGETGNAFNTIANRLDDIKALGVNVLWLMPVYEQGELNAFGSPYSVRDFKKVNPDYGTLTELKALINKAHDKDMRVMFDWIANHTSWDNSWITNKSWYTQDAAGNIVSPPGTDWTDVADLNYDNADMRAAMLDAILYWVRETGIDGYRCDYADGVPHDFWRQTIDELRQLKGDDLIMLAETGDARLYDAGFDMIYGWDFESKLEDVYNGKTTLTNLYASHRQEYQNTPEGKQRLRFITNHDIASEKSPIQVYKGEHGALSAFVIATTLAGTPLIYSSQEIGYAQPLSFFNHNPLNWNSNPNYTAEYKRIMDIYTSSEALKKGTLRIYESGNIASYYKESQNEAIFIMVNTTNNSVVAKVPIEQAYEEGTNLLNNTTSVLPVSINMEPYQYYIWKMK